MTVSQFRRLLYRGASLLGDVQAVRSGDPGKMLKRAVRKTARRKVSRKMNQLGL